MPEWLGLEGRRVLVAGGAGTIGAAIVGGFLDAGADVGVIDRSRESLSRLPAAVTARLEADLRDRHGCRSAVEAAIRQLDGFDVFVHCAGVNDRKPIEQYTGEDWDTIIGVNLSSAFHTTQVVAPHMRDRGHGRIVFLSSVAGRSGHREHGPYAASKAGLNQLMRVTANEYAEHGVTVNAVAPGYMETALTTAYLDEHPEKRRALMDLIPARRFGHTDEVVGPVLFLASRQASFVTGHVLYIDGGRSIT